MKRSLALLVLLGTVGIAEAQSPVTLAPTFRVGDEWQFSDGSRLTVVNLEDGFVVTTRSPGRRRCPDCRYYRDKNFTVVKVLGQGGENAPNMEVGLQTLDFPLRVGKKWTSNVDLYSEGREALRPVNNTFEVERYGDVQTKAGVFKAYAITWRRTWQEGQRRPREGSARTTLWYSHDVRAIVKLEAHTAGSTPRDYELEAFTLKD
jgi:hypothetical protein